MLARDSLAKGIHGEPGAPERAVRAAVHITGPGGASARREYVGVF